MTKYDTVLQTRQRVYYCTQKVQVQKKNVALKFTNNNPNEYSRFKPAKCTIPKYNL